MAAQDCQLKSIGMPSIDPIVMTRPALDFSSFFFILVGKAGWDKVYQDPCNYGRPALPGFIHSFIKGGVKMGNSPAVGLSILIVDYQGSQHHIPYL